MSKSLTSPSPVLADLNRMIEEHGSQAALARRFGYSEAYISDILSGKRGLSAGFLEQMGYVKIVIHVKADKEKDTLKAIKAVQEGVK